VTPPETPLPDTDPLHLVAADMAEVDRWIQTQLQSDVPLIGQVATYIISAGGKRVRPALLLMMAGALNCRNDQRINLAAVVEFIHTATLLHDDVVDESALRRGQATANRTFGNAASVLVGDFLYSRAFQMMVSANNPRVMSILADATNVIAEGEVQQLMHMHNASLTEEQYLQVIRSKTAKLFEASTRLAAVIAGSDTATEEAAANYGGAIGTAFQIVDDALDYSGDAATMGKNLGDDLREGKVTLPLIVALQRGSAAEQALIRQAIELDPAEGSHAGPLDKTLADIQTVIERTQALKATALAAERFATQAATAARALPSNPYQLALLESATRLNARIT
jgi:octaprenyl-diphosphate synthase